MGRAWAACSSPPGSHYAASVLRGLDCAGVVRASFAHYNSREEVAAFLETLSALAPARP